MFVKPDYIFFSEQLTPHHFSDEANAYLYYGIKELVRRGIENIDAYNLINLFNAKEATKPYADKLPIASINELIDVAPIIARETPNEYRLLVDQVMDAAFRRDAYKKLRECETLCLKQDDSENIQTKIFREVESLITKYQKLDELVPMSDKIDGIWNQITSSQVNGDFIEFNFPSLNKYVKLSRTEAICVAAKQKRGKSMLLMNWMVDLLEKGQRVLYIDSELDDTPFTMRLISHLTQVEFYNIRDGKLTQDEYERVQKAIAWIKTKSFCHIKIESLDGDKIISIVKKYKYTYGLDVVILDYLKSNTAYYLDAFQNSAVLGNMTDILKNYIASELELFVLFAVQASGDFTVADSKKIARNCSTLMFLERKSSQEIEQDGDPNIYGNMRLTVTDNRNGEIMAEDEYISLFFDGNRCTFREAKQPVRAEPY